MSLSYAPENAGIESTLDDLTRFEEFVLAHSHVVLSACLRLLHDRSAAEDARQETFATAWRHRRSLEPSRAWLLRVATNKCFDELRRRHRYPMVAGGEEGAFESTAGIASPEARILSLESQDLICAALQKLPRPQRTAIVLADIEGWPYCEIASACGVTVGTVKSRIFRARRTLRVLLADAGLPARAHTTSRG